MTVAALLRDIEEQCFDTSPEILKPILNRVLSYSAASQYMLIKALARRTGTTSRAMTRLVQDHNRTAKTIPKSKRLSPRGQALHFEYYWNRHSR